MHNRNVGCPLNLWLLITVSATLVPLRAAEPGATNAHSNALLIQGPLGKLVVAPTNTVPSRLLPPANKGMTNQIPTPSRGITVPAPVRAREEGQRVGRTNLTFFPSYSVPLAPYLEAQDDHGNTALKPGALIPWTPMDAVAQQAKYWASDIGLRYTFQQSLAYVNMTDVMQGDNSLGYYTLSLTAKQAVYDDPASRTAGWLSSQFKVKTAIGPSAYAQSPRSNLGTITSPADSWSGFNGIALQELAWQQSAREGELVLLAGVINQSNYLDVNAYANSGRGQFLNSALVNTMVSPLPTYRPGVNAQWQFAEDWYAMVGASAGAASAGDPPWAKFSFDDFSVAWELGYMPKDAFGLGPGVYRIEPFIARVTGTTSTTYTTTLPGSTNSTDVTFYSDYMTPVQGGVCFNFQQQLGPEAPLGCFGRFAVGASAVSAGAKAQIGAGFVMRGPLAEAGLFPSRNHDAAGLGFVWSQPSATTKTIAHENEYVLETGYVLQLTPLAKIQPDFQVVWNPAYNAGADHAFVFQIQLDVKW